MKICILNPIGMPTDIPPSLGGVQTVTQSLAESLVREGCDVYVLSRTRFGENRTDFGINGVKTQYYRFSKCSFINDLANNCALIKYLLYYPFLSIRIFPTLIKIKPDIVHVQNHQFILAAYLLKIITGTPYIVVKHAGGKFGLFNRPFAPVLKKIWYKIPYVTATNRYVCLTNQEKNEFNQLFGANSIVIPNGVDLSVFSNSNDLDDDQQYNILCVSRLSPRKGLESVISAIPKIRDVFPKITLFIAGDGELLQSLEKSAEEIGVQDAVRFLGPKTHMELVEYYSNSQIYIMPSLCESFSLTILEAIACGLPIISTPVGVAPEIIDKWKNGVLVEPDNPDSIADAVIDLFSNRDKLKEYSDNSLKAQNSISWDSVAKRYIELYEEILGEQ